MHGVSDSLLLYPAVPSFLKLTLSLNQTTFRWQLPDYGFRIPTHNLISVPLVGGLPILSPRHHTPSHTSSVHLSIIDMTPQAPDIGLQDKMLRSVSADDSSEIASATSRLPEEWAMSHEHLSFGNVCQLVKLLLDPKLKGSFPAETRSSRRDITQ